MPHRFATLVAPMLALAVAGTPAGARADDRSRELVKSFQNFCLPGPPDFATLDAKAAALNLALRKDIVAPQRPGLSARTKSWTVVLGSGSHELVAAEAHGGPKGDTASCGIGADDARGDDVKQEIVMLRGAPLREGATADGAQRLTTWAYAEDVTIVLADGTPMRIPGIFLLLLQQKNTGR